MFISKVATLFIALFFTNFLFAQEKDTLAKKEFGAQLAAGSQINLKGIYFTAGGYYTKNKIRYTLQYNYYGFNYVNLDAINFKGFLEQSNSVSILIGLNIPFNNWSASFNGGLSIGTGRFVEKGSSYNYGYIVGDYVSYFKTNFFGLIFNCASKYHLTDKINLGLSFTTFLNYYFKYQRILDSDEYELNELNNYYGLQISMEYKIKPSGNK